VEVEDALLVEGLGGAQVVGPVAEEGAPESFPARVGEEREVFDEELLFVEVEGWVREGLPMHSSE
jgi:hypothetical protein